LPNSVSALIHTNRKLEEEKLTLEANNRKLEQEKLVLVVKLNTVE